MKGICDFCHKEKELLPDFKICQKCLDNEARRQQIMKMDNFLYCDKHCDLWQSGCPRCEECCQRHYGRSVKEQFNDNGSIEQRSQNWQVFTGDSLKNMKLVKTKDNLKALDRALGLKK